MTEDDIPYYLERIRFHRERHRDAPCPEARICHARLIRAYRQRLVDIRSRRPSESGAPPPFPPDLIRR